MRINDKQIIPTRVETRFQTVILAHEPKPKDGNGSWHASYRTGDHYDEKFLTITFTPGGMHSGEVVEMKFRFTEEDMCSLSDFAEKLVWEMRQRDQGNPPGRFICKNCVNGMACCPECKGTGRTP